MKRKRLLHGLVLGAIWLLPAYGQAQDDKARSAECVEALRALAPTAMEFTPVSVSFGAPTNDDELWERLSVTRLSRYLSHVLPPDDPDRLSLANARLTLNGLPQSNAGGTVFNTLATAHDFIRDLIDKYARTAHIVRETRLGSIRPITVCYDSLYGTLAVRSEGVCWLVRKKGDPEQLDDWEALAAPGPECALGTKPDR